VNVDGSRADKAHSQLKAAIRSRKFLPGQRMREVELAEWLGVSRTPVREALSRLQTEGLVTPGPRDNGLVIATLDGHQVSELYAVRASLEGLAARLSAIHATAGEFEAMRAIVARQASAPENDPQGLAHLNTNFHSVLYRGAHNRYLLELLKSVECTLALLPGTTFSAQGRPESALREHVEIVEAVTARDPDRAEEAARAHIRTAELVRQKMIAMASDGLGMPLPDREPHVATSS
jgi:DNA-binding GntR family transcriptional regulator